MDDQGFRQLVVPPELWPLVSRTLRTIGAVPVLLPSEMTGDDELPTYVIHPAPAAHTAPGA